MPRLLVISHAEVIVDPDVPVTNWGLNAIGRHRAARFAASDQVRHVTHIWASFETKARETADILAKPRDIPISFDVRLGENDRSATGFLPPPSFETAANAFFADPETSYEGWETALDAQSRIVGAVSEITRQHSGGDLAIVTHGAVGTLLYCNLKGLAIDRAHDQPGQGHYWTADLKSLCPDHGWKAIA
ncbi:histidine phosphatase family protein [Marivita sp.]|uniref:histidine phosphatase family protein n=1 Tax=Marivita sp. TaxID=2003365 RepID=UPI003F6A9ADA